MLHPLLNALALVGVPLQFLLLPIIHRQDGAVQRNLSQEKADLRSMIPRYCTKLTSIIVPPQTQGKAKWLELPPSSPPIVRSLTALLSFLTGRSHWLKVLWFTESSIS